MIGTNANNGKHIGDYDHLRQSITDILTTPLGSRVMRRDYGSRLYELIDRPLNPSTFLDIQSATVEAILKWEPRYQVTSVQAKSVESGSITISLYGNYLPSGEQIKLDGIAIQ